MKDVLEIISSILGIVISCITIYQFIAQRPSSARLQRNKAAQVSQQPQTVPAVPQASVASQPTTINRPDTVAINHTPSRQYLLALATFIVMPFLTFFLLHFYVLWSQYSYTSQEAVETNTGGALLAGSSLALMILLIASSRQRAIIAIITFAIIYSLVLLDVILLYATIYFSFPILDSSLAGGNVLAAIAANLVTFVILRGAVPSRQQYIFSIITFTLILLVTYLGPVLYAHQINENITVNTIVGGGTIALIVATTSLLTILFTKGTTRTYIIVLVIFVIVYFVILFFLLTMQNMTYNALFYLFDEAGIGASTIAFVGGGLAAVLFLKIRGQHV